MNINSTQTILELKKSTFIFFRQEMYFVVAPMFLKLVIYIAEKYRTRDHKTEKLKRKSKFDRRLNL